MTATILVTGGAGYIGSHTCKALSARGLTPVTFDNLVYGHPDLVQWGPLEKGDLADPTALDTVFERYAPRAVIHFAAYAYVGESVSDPARYYRNNVCGTLNLLDAMRRHGCRSIIFSSTCATYGIPSAVPIPENHPQRPINPYGRSKLFIEHILEDYRQAYDMRYVALRYFNAAGADPDGETGEDHDPEPHLIPSVLFAAAGKRSHVDIFGTDYPTPDGTAVRDYIHVSDLADAHVRAFDHLERTAASECINLGTGTGLSVRQIIDTVSNVTGTPVPFREAERRPGDPPELVAEPEKARNLLGWQSRHSDAETIIRTAWNWHRKRHLHNAK
ncbi:UDP-glucose 4-epimerase GalE [Prosthecochloris sp. N3]|uniref:UDP-glucose 4-epimerase n=1 Tax=Prosthecochloris ethylica TaxID=2743976 RepID=A0ABR9XRR3_9CHLB|nr:MULTISPECIES: UDP-glucose 4-epimerase GalE [Prosthecochloris]MBF0586763.1 UDP-glucose 4-epimerase GalE [Prosthecochloris ethylica]MBF0636669.1 UDP-glucose 4-epimerase GalE [Prosthecochloris ethylica]NUK47932.1 UDP-glucose 4-epimerase GalE [Prosthecochloris ethylica]RNA65234.1 UDP-glucose 4-epimerase GalE [Prosthecochloris sp. ZM_2]